MYDYKNYIHNRYNLMKNAKCKKSERVKNLFVNIDLN